MRDVVTKGEAYVYARSRWGAHVSLIECHDETWFRRCQVWTLQDYGGGLCIGRGHTWQEAVESIAVREIQESLH